MADHKIIRCDCGYRVRALTEERQVADVRRHAWQEHGIALSIEDALGVLLRFELDEGLPAGPATVEDTTDGKEHG